MRYFKAPNEEREIMSEVKIHYDYNHIKFLEKIWGNGYMSPGGFEEVKLILKETLLEGKSVLDIGCGIGGITVGLVKDFLAGKVIGIDVEEVVCKLAIERVQKAGLCDIIEIMRVNPGKFPFADNSFDIVFSKDSIVHISDKEFLAEEVYRVLRPGGCFVASDWMISNDDEISVEMQHYLNLENLGFGMASPVRYGKALEKAGFVGIKSINRNDWYQKQAKVEFANLKGVDRPIYENLTSIEFIEQSLKTWEAMMVVLDTGEHCPHHIRALKRST